LASGATRIWYPRIAAFGKLSGLNVGATYIDRIRWTPQFERWEIGFEAFVAGERQNDIQIKETECWQPTAGERYVRSDRRRVHRRIALSDPGIDDYRNGLLWSPEKPTLIDALIQLWYRDKLIDEVVLYRYALCCIQRDRFMLNGRPYYAAGSRPRLLARYTMTAPSDEALRRDVES